MLKTHLSKYICYSPTSGEIVRLMPNGGKPAGRSAITRNTDGRPRVVVCKRNYSASQISWIWEHGEMPPTHILHRDGDFNNYHISNLCLIGERARMDRVKLMELFEYNPTTGLFTYKQSPQYSIKVGDVAGSKQPSGYLVVGVQGRDYRLHRLAFLYMTGSIPNQVDHINHDRSDNRWVNLRAADKRINARNMSKQTRNTSGYNGVWYDKQRCKWCAEIFTGKDKKHLGRYEDKEDAIAARKAADKVYGFHENHGK